MQHKKKLDAWHARAAWRGVCYIFECLKHVVVPMKVPEHHTCHVKCSIQPQVRGGGVDYMQERTISKEAEGREDKVDVSLCSQDCSCCSCCCRARCCACCKHSGDSSITVMRFTDAFPEIKLILLERNGRHIK